MQALQVYAIRGLRVVRRRRRIKKLMGYCARTVAAKPRTPERKALFVIFAGKVEPPVIKKDWSAGSSAARNEACGPSHVARSMVSRSANMCLTLCPDEEKRAPVLTTSRCWFQSPKKTFVMKASKSQWRKRPKTMLLRRTSSMCKRQPQWVQRSLKCPACIDA